MMMMRRMMIMMMMMTRFRCEVSNEFPTFETVSTAEILTVVGRSREIETKNICW